MDSIGFSLLLLACAVYSVSCQLPMVTSGGAAVSVGDTGVELKCIVTNLDQFSQTIKWIKTDLKNKNKYEEISANIEIVAKDALQYKMTATRGPGPEDATYTLTLAELRPEDDGFYKCVVVRAEKPLVFEAESTQELIVKQPITSVVLNAGSTQVSASDSPNTKTVQLEQFDSNLVLGCQVQGSNPEARIELTVGGESILSEVLRQDQVNIKGKSSSKYYRTYNTDLDTTGKKKFTDSIIGKHITCSAWMDDGTPDQANPMTASIIITLKEPPKVECTDVTSRLGDRRVTLTCTIESVVKPEKITWYVRNNGDPLFIPATKQYQEEYIADQSDLGDNRYQVTLEIGLIEEKHFDNIYTLQAVVPGNDISHVVRLQKSMTVSTPGESGTGGVGHISITATVFIFTMLFGSLMRRWM